MHEQILSLPDETAVYPGHDYKGRTVSTVGEEKRFNPRLGGDRTVEQFVEIMDNLNLPMPKRIHEALPANMDCGVIRLPLPQQDQPRVPAASWAPIEMAADDVPEVAPRWLASASHVVIIDVRETDELVGPLGAIEGAVNVPLGSLTRQVDRWSGDQAIALICRSGARSGAACRMMMALGFEKVVSVRGGMVAWNELASHRPGRVDARRRLRHGL